MVGKSRRSHGHDPALIMTGEADDWTPVKDCERWMARRAGRGAPVTFIVYPGVYHSFFRKSQAMA